MANTIKIKRNTSDSDAPTTSNIAQGEIAFTEATQILFYRDASDNIRKIGGEGAFLRSDTNDTMSGNLTVTGNHPTTFARISIIPCRAYAICAW